MMFGLRALNICMKKIILICLPLFMLTAVNAQKLQLGLKAGVNFSNLRTDNFDYDARVGVHGGLLAHIHLNRNWAIQPEILYSTEGAKYNGPGNLVHDEHLDFIQIPVLAQYMFGPGFRVEAGPQLGFLINAKDDLAGRASDIDAYRKNVNFAFAIGAGYLSSIGLGVDARVNLGLSNLRENNGPSLHQNVFQLGIFYQLKH